MFASKMVWKLSSCHIWFEALVINAFTLSFESNFEVSLYIVSSEETLISISFD